LDVDGDGQVTVIDLAIVALFYGTQVPVGVSLPADVNADGVVNLLDLTAVAQGIDAAGGVNVLSLQDVAAALLAGEFEVVAGSPVGSGRHQHVLSGEVVYSNVTAALADVKHLATGDVRLGKELAMLSELLQLLAELTVTPETTALLPNYPNPFNPETTIPYDLSSDAIVSLTVYNIAGQVVRKLVDGEALAAGQYQAVWDGRSESGASVASGMYFYLLHAGDYVAKRKMVLLR